MTRATRFRKRKILIKDYKLSPKPCNSPFMLYFTFKFSLRIDLLEIRTIITIKLTILKNNKFNHKKKTE